jgi:hypothetical protein
MCSYHTLYHSEINGYVVRCKQCENIQIGFSNLMLTVNEVEFDSLRALIKLILEEQKASEIRATVRHIVIPTPCESMKLLLSVRELREFDNMLEEADTELQSSSLTKLFTTS